MLLMAQTGEWKSHDLTYQNFPNGFVKSHSYILCKISQDTLQFLIIVHYNLCSLHYKQKPQKYAQPLAPIISTAHYATKESP